MRANAARLSAGTPAAYPEFETQQVHRIEIGGRQLGFVVVDSSIEGRARGGLRLAPDISELELRAAARAMTLKYGLLGLPQGGAKAGLHGDPDAPLAERRAQLLGFGRAIEPLLRGKVYIPDADLGTRGDDIRWLMQTLGLTVGRYDWQGNRSGEYTAISCAAAARAALASRGENLEGCRVAIEGFGNVGAVVAKLLRDAGARIVALSTSRGALYDPNGLDVDRVASLASTDGSALVDAYSPARRIEREQLLELPVDLLCPCARHHSLHSGNSPAVAAAVICPGANNPASPAAERQLTERGVLYIPDFVSYCGGVLGGTLEFAGVAPARIATLVSNYVDATVRSLINVAAHQQCALRAVAEPLAFARHKQIQTAIENPAVGNRILGAALEVYRRGWIPRRLVAAVAVQKIMGSTVKIDQQSL